jgi:hypothetical protein
MAEKTPDNPVTQLENGVAVPLTSEEVVQRQRDQAAGEGSRPEREAEAALAKAADDSQALLHYEDRIVAFLHVLGWGAAVERSAHDPSLIKTLGIAQNLLAATATHTSSSRQMVDQQGTKEGVRVTQLSDTIIISAPLTWTGIDHILRHLGLVTATFLQQDLLIRGAIVHGQVYHRDFGVFGPALMAAHDGEKLTRHPRVTIDPRLAEVAMEMDKVDDGEAREYLYRHKNWRTDDDGVVFYDFLQPLNAMSGFEGQFDNGSNARLNLSRAKALATRNIAEFTADPAKRGKHEWLLRYARAVAAEYGIDFETL